jgi:hypothetical protein
MLDQPPGHPWHAHCLPCEDVSVSPKQDDKCIFLFRVQPRADHGSLATIAGPKVDGLHLHFLCWLRLVCSVGLLGYLEFSWGKLL